MVDRGPASNPATQSQQTDRTATQQLEANRGLVGLVEKTSQQDAHGRMLTFFILKAPYLMTEGFRGFMLSF